MLACGSLSIGIIWWTLIMKQKKKEKKIRTYYRDSFFFFWDSALKLISWQHNGPVKIINEAGKRFVLFLFLNE